MFLPTFLALSSSVLLASNASVLSSDTDDADPTATFRGLSFTAKATPNANKGASDNNTLQNESNMEVHRPIFPSLTHLTLCPLQSTPEM